MAVNQTLVLMNTLPVTPKMTMLLSSSSSSFSNLSFSQRLISSSSARPKIKQLACNLTTRCSMEYGGRSGGSYYDQSPVYPKPSEIPWKKELCNSVQLIGIVGAPVEIKHLNSGKAVAWTRLAAKKSATETVWINLTFWDDLAHVANQHVEKGQQIYISGRLVSDTVENNDGKQQTYYKVVVQQLNYVEKNWSSAATFDSDPSSMTAGKKFGSSSANMTGSTEELWQAFFANPVDWWDNRANKRNPKYPDFKHKDTGEALWLEGKYNPPWVKSQLAILDSRMASHQEQDSRMTVSSISSDSFDF